MLWKCYLCFDLVSASENGLVFYIFDQNFKIKYPKDDFGEILISDFKIDKCEQKVTWSDSIKTGQDSVTDQVKYFWSLELQDQNDISQLNEILSQKDIKVKVRIDQNPIIQTQTQK